MRRGSFLLAVASTIAILGLAGCGSGNDGDETARGAPSAKNFPSADGKTIDEMLELGTESELVVSPAATVFELGNNRYPFGVFEVDMTQVDEAEVALYFAKSPQSPVEGPLPARVDSLETKPAFAAKGSTGSGDPTTVYAVDDVEFNRSGPWLAVALINRDGELEATRPTSSPIVGQFPGIPRVGQKAPKVSTPTTQSVGGDLSQIDTRQPPSSMHDVNLKDVLGKKPVVLVFATPALCVSRVCGPVVDVVEQVKAEVGDEVAFIHQEVFNDNDPNKGVRPQLKAYGLQTEPWTFLIDKEGRIEQRIEGAYGVAELRAAVEKLEQTS